MLYPICDTEWIEKKLDESNALFYLENCKKVPITLKDKLIKSYASSQMKDKKFVACKKALDKVVHKDDEYYKILNACTVTKLSKKRMKQLNLVELCSQNQDTLNNYHRGLVKLIFPEIKNTEYDCKKHFSKIMTSKHLDISTCSTTDIQNFEFLKEFKGIKKLTLYEWNNDKFCASVGKISNTINVQNILDLQLEEIIFPHYYEQLFNLEESWRWILASKSDIKKLNFNSEDCVFTGEMKHVIRIKKESTFYCNNKEIESDIKFNKLDTLIGYVRLEEIPMSDLANTYQKTIDECIVEKNGESCFKRAYLLLHYYNDTKAAVRYYRTGCQLKNRNSCINHINALLYESAQTGIYIAEGWLKNLCNDKHVESCNLLDKIKIAIKKKTNFEGYDELILELNRK